MLFNPNTKKVAMLRKTKADCRLGGLGSVFWWFCRAAVTCYQWTCLSADRSKQVMF